MTSNLFAGITEVAKDPSEGTKEEGILEGVPAVEDEEEQDDTPSEATELAMLKSRAKMMGITFSPNIGLAALKEKVNNKLNETDSSSDIEDEDEDEDETIMQEQAQAPVVQTAQGTVPLVQTLPKATSAPTATKKTPTLRQYLEKKHLALVRVQIANLDPKDAELNGEYITVANEYLGTITHLVPFGEITDDGWHLPRCIVEELKSRKFLQLRTRGKGANQHVEQNWVRKFNVVELPPLTPEELSRLAQAQLASGRLDKE